MSEAIATRHRLGEEAGGDSDPMRADLTHGELIGSSPREISFFFSFFPISFSFWLIGNLRCFWMGNAEAKPDTSASKRPCQKLACEIQACLQKNDFDSSKCVDTIRVYDECVARAKSAEREGGKEVGGGLPSDAGRK